ncbi:MAG: hemerythrin domain-containing protein [Halieaceae bacterium]|jgi:hemerythrin-like domain-containing protein|nr:hemerythrin domain-containing protein [Halieaceae bacterium]
MAESNKAHADAYSKEAWDAVALTLRGGELSAHPVLATLYAEHRYMGTLQRLVEAELERIDADEPVDPHVFYESLHYLTHYPDAFHHPREDLVYARAGEVDPALADSVDTLQRDHDFLAKTGAKTLATVARWKSSGTGTAKMREAVAAYVHEQRKHMEAEEALVFPEIQRVLDPEDWRELEQDSLLAPTPDPIFGPKVAREYRNVARKARRALRKGAEDAALVEWIGLEAFLEGLEVLSIAGESGRAAAQEHLYAAGGETLDLLRKAMQGEGILSLPLKTALTGGSHYLGFLKDLGTIARDAGSDLSELRRGARQRMGLVFDKKPGQATSSSSSRN